MKIYPRDLGKKRYLTVLRRRARASARRNMAVGPGHDPFLLTDPPKPRRGILGRFWARGLGLDPATEREALAVMNEGAPGMSLLSVVHLLLLFATLFLLFPALGALAGGALIPAFLFGLAFALIGGGVLLAYPRGLLRQLHATPLTSEEVEALFGGLTAQRNRVERAYGGLVLDATVPRSVKFEEANARKLTILEHAPKSPGALAYQALTTEVMSRGHRSEEERDDAPLGHLRGDDAA